MDITQLKQPITVTISGPHNTGRTTLANLLKMFLEENGYRNVEVQDTEPLPADQKEAFWNRFQKNRERPVRIRVQTEMPSGVLRREPMRAG